MRAFCSVARSESAGVGRMHQAVPCTPLVFVQCIPSFRSHPAAPCWGGLGCPQGTGAGEGCVPSVLTLAQTVPIPLTLTSGCISGCWRAAGGLEEAQGPLPLPRSQLRRVLGARPGPVRCLEELLGSTV